MCSCVRQNSDQAYHIAKLLSITASQHPDMARTLLVCQFQKCVHVIDVLNSFQQHLDMASIFDAQTLDEDTLLFLLDAAANVDIARDLHADFFTAILHEIQGSVRVSKATQLIARRLSARIRGWHCFEDALSNTRGNFNESSSMLKDVGTEEQSMGTWLESMVIHDDMVTKLAENPVLPTPQSNPPYATNITSHDDYVVLVRAFIGVASVLSVFAWTDSLGNDVCREHTLGILHLWQKVDGYREVRSFLNALLSPLMHRYLKIVNHLLLLRQLTRRLEWISTENDPPRKSGVLAERVLSDLAKDPHAILHDDLVQAILALKPPLSVIADNERLSMRKVALVAEDGLSAAVEEIMFSSDHPLSLRRLRTLRVSLAIVERELKNSKDDWRILQIFWEEQDRGIVPRLVELLVGVSDDLNDHFALSPSPRMNQMLAEQLFRTADDLIRLTMRLGPAFPMTSRDMRNLTLAASDIFACTDAADMTFAQTNSACMSAQATRQTCLDLVRILSGPKSYAEPGKLGAEVVMRTLLDHGGQHGERDPVYHLLQIFTMIDHILPESSTLDDENDPSYWVMSVLPNLLNEIKSFFRRLDTDNQVHFIKTLIKLDNGVTGIAEWLLMQELMYLSESLQSLLGPMRADYRLVLLHQVTLSLHLLVDLIVPSSSSSTWCLTAISTISDLAGALKTSLTALLDGHYMSLHLRRLAFILAISSRSFESDLRFTVLLLALRVVQIDPTFPGVLKSTVETLRELPMESMQSEALRLELGQTFSAYAQLEHEHGSETSDTLLLIFEWLAGHENKRFLALPAITSAAFTKLCELMHTTLSTDKADTLSTLRSKFVIDEDEFFRPTPIELVQSLDLSMQNLEDLLRNDVPTPSTPKGNKTPDILGVVISPPTAILRSPATTGLTKTYTNNDFRQLRQIPSAKQNMSRLPSMHGMFQFFL